MPFICDHISVSICHLSHLRTSIKTHLVGIIHPGEMVVGPAKVLLMDSISTGLDSSTTFLIVSCMRNFCHFMDATVCISLLQPPPGEAVYCEAASALPCHCALND